MASPRQALFGPAAGMDRTVAILTAAGPPARLARHADMAAPLARALREAGEPGPFAGLEDETSALAGVLGELYAIFAAPTAGDTAERLNAALARHTGPLRLVEEPGAPWHLHAERRGDDSWAGWLAATCLTAMAIHFAEHGAPGFGVCAASDCIQVYAQTGPGRARHTCSPRCAGRRRQAELRARRRAG